MKKSEYADLDFQKHKDKNIKFNQRIKRINIFDFFDYLIIFIRKVLMGKNSEIHTGIQIVPKLIKESKQSISLFFFDFLILFAEAVK